MDHRRNQTHKKKEKNTTNNNNKKQEKNTKKVASKVIVFVVAKEPFVHDRDGNEWSKKLRNVFFFSLLSVSSED